MTIDREKILSVLENELDEQEFHQALSYFDGDLEEMISSLETIMYTYQHIPAAVNACLYAVQEGETN